MNTHFTLTDPDLLRQQCLMGGRWLNATDGSTCDVFNPATGARIGSVPNMGATETREAIAAARRAKLTNEEGITRLLSIK
jgi:succinate-semialdehyde dehydrogenase / glutarate-semialdehyde dehydrogenase